MATRSSHFALVSALAAGVGYGGWAAYANYDHEAHIWMMAGAIQAVYAFGATLSITHMARWTYRKYDCSIRGTIAGFAAGFILMLLIPITIHSLSGTPNIIMTILPGLIWGSIYLLSFLLSLHRAERRIRQANGTIN